MACLCSVSLVPMAKRVGILHGFSSTIGPHLLSGQIWSHCKQPQTHSHLSPGPGPARRAATGQAKRSELVIVFVFNFKESGV